MKRSFVLIVALLSLVGCSKASTLPTPTALPTSTSSPSPSATTAPTPAPITTLSRPTAAQIAADLNDLDYTKGDKTTFVNHLGHTVSGVAWRSTQVNQPVVITYATGSSVGLIARMIGVGGVWCDPGDYLAAEVAIGAFIAITQGVVSQTPILVEYKIPGGPITKFVCGTEQK